MLKAEGFDNAILGVTALPDGTEVLVYDKRRCRQILLFTLGLDSSAANGFFEFNGKEADLGNDAPLYVEPYFEDEFSEVTEDDD